MTLPDLSGMTANAFVLQQATSLRIAVLTESYPTEVNGVAMTPGRLVEAVRRRSHHAQLIHPR